MSRLAPNLLTLVVGLFAALTLSEAGLRLVDISYPRVGQRDANRGTSYRPGIRFRSVGEGGADVAINAEGFRDRDYSTARVPQSTRIAVLGDSYVDAVAVAAQDRFTDRLPHDLATVGAPGEPTVEVLNFGMAGYGTAQELQVLRHHVVKYAPDVVILAFLPFNDLRNNYKPLERDPGRPYFELADGNLILDDSFRSLPDRGTTLSGRTVYWLIDNLRTVQLAYEARREWGRRRQTAGAQAIARAQGLMETGLQSAAFIPPPNEQWAEAWRVTEAIMVQMHREVQELGASFLVVTLTSAAQVDPDPAVRNRLQTALGVDHLFYAEQRIGALCEKEGIAHLPLGEAFQTYAASTGVYLHGFPNSGLGQGHWNEAGHALASQLIARALVKKHLLPR